MQKRSDSIITQHKYSYLNSRRKKHDAENKKKAPTFGPENQGRANSRLVAVRVDHEFSGQNPARTPLAFDVSEIVNHFPPIFLEEHRSRLDHTDVEESAIHKGPNNAIDVILAVPEDITSWGPNLVDSREDVVAESTVDASNECQRSDATGGVLGVGWSVVYHEWAASALSDSFKHVPRSTGVIVRANRPMVPVPSVRSKDGHPYLKGLRRLMFSFLSLPLGVLGGGLSREVLPRAFAARRGTHRCS